MRGLFPLRFPTVVSLFLFGSLVLASSVRAQVADVPPVNTNDRAQVAGFYRLYYQPSAMVPHGWTGSVAAGTPGTLGFDYRRATLRRINYYRAMSGLPGNVVFSADANARCQQTALMMSAQGAVSHTPARDWRFYTPVAADTAAHANLDLDWRGDEGPGAIDRYMADTGRENDGVGHRRWLLYNAARVMGTGIVPAAGSGYPGANVTFIGGPAPCPSDAPPSAAWPPAGFVPAPLVYDRWSFAYDDADFHLARICVTKNGAPVAAVREPVRFQTRPDGTGRIVGNNTLVWTLPGNAVSRTADETYRVRIDHVYIAGTCRQFDYAVTSIDPAAVRHAVRPTAPPRQPPADDLTTLMIADNFSRITAKR